MTNSNASPSWSALLVGWPHGEPSLTEIRRLAEERILSAGGDTLVALSELASLRGDESRADATPHLTTLAAAEGWPPYFARREWQLRRLAQALDYLGDVPDLDGLPDGVDSPELDAHQRCYSLKQAMTTLELGAQTPVVFSYLSAAAEHGDLNHTLLLTVDELHAWIEQQWRLLAVAAMLRDTGQHEALSALAQAFEDAEGNHALHMEQARAERATYERQLTLQNAAKARSEQANWNFWRLLGRLIRR